MTGAQTNPANKPIDPEHPTHEPFTSPGEPSNVNNCNCCGIFLVPLAALAGFIDQIIRKTGRLFNKDTRTEPVK